MRSTRPDDPSQLMALHGDTVAWALCAGAAGNSDTGSGWCGASRAAADLSGRDPDILRIAEESYAASRWLHATTSLRSYATAAATTARSPLAACFVHGMLEHLHDLPDR